MRTKFYAENFLRGGGDWSLLSPNKYVGFYSAIAMNQKSQTISGTEMLFCSEMTFLPAFAFWRLHS